MLASPIYFSRPFKWLASFSFAVICATLFFHGASKSTFRSPASVNSNSVPTNDWVGLLILPKESERKADGGIWFQVLAAPDANASWIGQSIWLKWNESDPQEKALYHSRFFDVQFCDRAKKQLALKAGKPVLRERVDNWKQVSPLESLAAGHAQDDMVGAFSADEILIRDPSKLEIEVTTEPTIVSGPRESVVRFISQISHTQFVVETIAAPKVQFTVELNLREDQVVPNTEKIDTDQFVKSAVNQKGWIIQGFQKQDLFEAYAASPYELYTISDGTFQLEANGKKFMERELWKLDTSLGRVQKTGVGATAYPFKIDDEFLLFNAFGSYDNAGTILGMVTGHAAIGMGRVIRHPQTGDLLLRSFYWQIYYNSPRGIVSAKFDTLSYNADFLRIESFYRPITDAFVPISALNGNTKLWDRSGRDFLKKSMETQMQNVRLAYGYGYLMETMVSNCVHDASNIFVSTVDHVLSVGKEEEEAYPIFVKAKASLGDTVWLPEKFHTCDGVQRWDGLPEALKNGRLSIPRRFHDAVVGGFVEAGLPVFALKTLLITQDATTLHPTAPFPIQLRDVLTLGLVKGLEAP